MFKRANKTPLDTKTKEFQYRCLQDILANKYWLHKWGIKHSPICTYCHKDIENIERMFWDCEITKHFWNTFEIFWRENVREVTLTKESVLLGTPEDMMCNTIIFSTKLYMYIRKSMKKNSHSISSKYICIIERKLNS